MVEFGWVKNAIATAKMSKAVILKCTDVDLAQVMDYTAKTPTYFLQQQV